MILPQQLQKAGFFKDHDGWSQSFYKEHGIVRIDLHEDLDSDEFEIFVSSKMGCSFVGKTKRITDIIRIVKSIDTLK